MKIAVITSIKAPYRTLQLEEICREKNIDMTVYYTNKGKEDRAWETRDTNIFNEVYLKSIRLFDKLGTLNTGLRNIVKNNDVIVLGGYEKLTYILMSLICRFYKKKYVIIFDGISCNRLSEKENKIKWLVKKIVIKNSSAIWGNGTVSKRYFNEVFNYPIERIYNQYLTVDGERIKELGKKRNSIRKILRDKYKIHDTERVIHYSGRLAKVKNVKILIEALSIIREEKITLFITGGGNEESELRELAEKLGVRIIITGFIKNQEELFKHYFISDVFILPSVYEPWGLVVNEAMYAKLPILISSICGCSLDLVKNNGYLFDPYSKEDLAFKISKIFTENSIVEKGNNSLKIIEKWSFYNSSKTFNDMIISINKDKLK